MLKKAVLILFSPFLFIISWLLLARIVRHFYKFPMPEFMADIIPNPGRLKGQPPDETAVRHGIQPGMTVLDMYSGGGYYTEMLSHIVGPEGSVIAHSNQAYAGFVGEEATNRYANNRLGNVEILMAENNELALPNASFDAIMMVLAYHDIYYVDPDNGWP